MVDADWARLVAYVVRDRMEAGYDTQRKFAEAIGLTEKSVSNFESGRNRMRRGTLSRVERVLNWVPGSAHVILGGGDPSYLETSVSKRTEADLRDATEREIWRIRDLTDEEKWMYVDVRRDRLAREAAEEAANRGHEDSA